MLLLLIVVLALLVNGDTTCRFSGRNVMPVPHKVAHRDRMQPCATEAAMEEATVSIIQYNKQSNANKSTKVQLNVFR
jgi:hypothetical protein